MLVALAALAARGDGSPYALVLAIDMLIAVLFAASLHFIMGPGGHALVRPRRLFRPRCLRRGAAACKSRGCRWSWRWPLAPLSRRVGALLFGWFCVRLSGVYLAMLTLAFAQIVWSIVFQWDDVTGGSNGLVGVWPRAPFEAPRYYLLCARARGARRRALLRRALFAPFGYALRAGRDSPLRAEAIGIDVKRVQWVAFVIAGAVAGLAGALFAFAKGTISPETLAVGRSVDGLVMVLLGGVQTLAGPDRRRGLFTWLQDTVARQTDYWRALLGLHHPRAGAGLSAAASPAR